MKSMAEHQVNGNLDEIGEQARALATFVEQSARDGIAAHEVEKSVWNKIIEMGRTTFGMFFRLCGDGDEGERVVLSDGREVRRLEGLHRREYQSVFGHFDLYRAVYGTWEARKIDYVPLDAKLRLPESTTPAFRTGISRWWSRHPMPRWMQRSAKYSVFPSRYIAWNDATASWPRMCRRFGRTCRCHRWTRKVH